MGFNCQTLKNILLSKKFIKMRAKNLVKFSKISHNCEAVFCALKIKKMMKKIARNWEKLCKSPRAKKGDSPGPSPDQVAFSLVIFVIALVGTFIFVWYTALKRNL